MTNELVTSSAVGVAAAALIAFVWNTFRADDGVIKKKQKLQERIFGTGEAGSEAVINVEKSHRISHIPLVREKLSQIKKSAEIAELLRRFNSKLSVSTFLALVAGLFIVTWMVLEPYLPFPFPIAVALVIASAPVIFLKIKNQKYIQKFEEYFPDALSIISNALKVGHGIEPALEAVAKTAPYPVSVEFQRVRAEMQLGQTNQAALKSLHNRIKLDEVKIFVTGLSLHDELGGNLSEILDNLEFIIRDRMALKREIASISAHGKSTAKVLFGAPLVVSAFYIRSSSDTFLQFMNSDFGQTTLWIGFFMQVVAFFWIKRIIRISD